MQKTTERLRNLLSSPPSEQVSGRPQCVASPKRGKKISCVFLAKQVCSQEHRSFSSSYHLPRGGLAETGYFKRSHGKQKKKPQGGTAGRLYFETVYSFLFLLNLIISNPISTRQETGSSVFSSYCSAKNIPRI